jgi:hypothetical protein
MHVHAHTHGRDRHSHIHFHEHGAEDDESFESHSHRVTRVGLKPVLVGAMHGLAGSAALTLLVLTQVHSVLLGSSYIVIFGFGSVFGMMVVSTSSECPLRSALAG